MDLDCGSVLISAPEPAAEIAATTASYDLHSKLRDYRRNGVREYIVWRVSDGAIDWFALREGVYVPIAADSQGVVRSETFPGLRLDVPEFLEGNIQRAIATLSQGVASPEHAAFAARLESLKKPASA